MNHIGKRIEDRRSKLGLTREDLGHRLGVTAQTVLNIERDPNYNLGTRLLLALEMALGVEFTIEMTEPEQRSTKTMNERIRMGNDEFILHIRKHYNCNRRNAPLGKKIWEWLEANAEGVKTTASMPCVWGSDIAAVGDRALPYTAQQFEFRLDALPDLYRFLGQLGDGTAPSEAEEEAGSE